MDKLRVAVIGCGGIATGKHIPSLKKIEEVEMVAFCDIDIDKAKHAAKHYGLSDVAFYKNYKELLKNEDIDVVHVCTPNSSHGFITVDALEAGCHVMCEKPMAKTVEAARSMLEASQRTGKKLTIGYQNRFSDEALYLKQACENDDLGEIYFAKAHAIRRRAVPTWGVFLKEDEQGGGPLIDIGTHALDLTLWFMNNYKPVNVLGSSYHKLREQRNTANAWGDWNVDEFTVEDSAFGFITMEDGSTIVLESSWALNTLEVGEAQSTLCGTKAGADMRDGLRINGVKYNKQYTEKPDFATGGVAFYDGTAESPADREARSWINCILNDTEPIVKPEEALVVTEVLDAIYRSAASGEPVKL